MIDNHETVTMIVILELTHYFPLQGRTALALCLDEQSHRDRRGHNPL